jgi:amino acid transporter
MMVLQTGSIALLAFVFGDYASQLFPLGVASSAVYAVLAVTTLTGLNMIGGRHSVWTQNVLTTVEVLGVLLIIGVGIAVAAPPPAEVIAEQPPRINLAGSLGMAMIFVLLTYGGWNEAA